MRLQILTFPPRPRPLRTSTFLTAPCSMSRFWPSACLAVSPACLPATSSRVNECAMKQSEATKQSRRVAMPLILTGTARHRHRPLYKRSPLHRRSPPRRCALEALEQNYKRLLCSSSSRSWKAAMSAAIASFRSASMPSASAACKLMLDLKQSSMTVERSARTSASEMTS